MVLVDGRRLRAGNEMSPSCQEKAQTAIAELREEKGLPPIDAAKAQAAQQRPARRAHRQTKWKRKKYTGKKKSGASASSSTSQETRTKRIFVGFFIVVLAGLGFLYYREFNRMVQQGKIGAQSAKKGKKKKKN